jgi:hypothetical protein
MTLRLEPQSSSYTQAATSILIEMVVVVVVEVVEVIVDSTLKLCKKIKKISVIKRKERNLLSFVVAVVFSCGEFLLCQCAFRNPQCSLA